VSGVSWFVEEWRSGYGKMRRVLECHVETGMAVQAWFGTEWSGRAGSVMERRSWSGSVWFGEAGKGGLGEDRRR
jgi:hypothetical protein